MNDKVFLFPLNSSILFKKVTLPFHIFEPRYIQMVNDALKYNVPIAIVPILSDSSYEETICVAGHPHIMATHPDGRMDIYITGSQKCRLLKRESDSPYMSYSYSEVSEDFISDDFYEMELDSFKNLLKRWSLTFLPDKNQREIFANTLEDPEILINYTTLFLVDNYQDKKSMMMAATKGEKIKILMQAIGPKEISLGPYMPVLKFK